MTSLVGNRVLLGNRIPFPFVIIVEFELLGAANLFLLTGILFNLRYRPQ